MMLAFAAACADPDVDGEIPPPPVAATPTPAPEDPDTDDEPGEPLDDGMDNNERGMSRYDPVVTLTTVRNIDPGATFAPGQSYDNNIWRTEYYEVLGIDLVVEWEAEGLPAYNERLNLAIAANDLPDMFQVNPAQLMSLRTAGRLTNMLPYLEHWGTDFFNNNLFNGDGGRAVELLTFDGELLAIPQSSVSTGDFHLMMIREDWRLDLGLPEPRTFDDMVNMARAFVEADPDGQRAYGWGIGNDISETWFTARGLFNAFGAFWNHWIDRDGELIYGNVQPEMRFALETLNSWFEEGLLDREMAAKNSWDVSLEALQGRTGIAIGMSWFLGWPLVPDGVANGQLWRPYLIPFHPDAPQQRIAAREAVGGVFVVRNGYEHPEALVKMCNHFQDRVMSGNWPVEIYKGDDEFNYEGLANVFVVVGPDRNRAADVLINQHINAGNMNPTDLDNEQTQWFEHARDFYLGEVVINFVREDGEEVEFRVSNDEVWEHIVSTRFHNRATLSIDDPDEDDIIAQLRGRYVGNFGNYWGRFGPGSIRGLSNHMESNNMFLVDKYYGPPTDSMQEFGAYLQDIFNTMAINVIVGALPIEAFDEFVANWHAGGGDAISAEVNEWYRALMS